jgi:hypothetical protein
MVDVEFSDSRVRKTRAGMALMAVGEWRHGLGETCE